MRCLDTVADNQQRQGADQSKKRRECRYKAYLFKVGHDASPTQHLRIGKNKNGDSLSVCSLSDASTEIFWDGVLPSIRLNIRSLRLQVRRSLRFFHLQFKVGRFLQ